MNVAIWLFAQQAFIGTEESLQCLGHERRTNTGFIAIKLTEIGTPLIRPGKHGKLRSHLR